MAPQTITEPTIVTGPKSLSSAFRGTRKEINARSNTIRNTKLILTIVLATLLLIPKKDWIKIAIGRIS
jgi:hypothetical protein